MINNNVDAIEIGTFNGDMHYLQGINVRELKRGVAGLEGNFEMGDKDWNWDASYVYGEQNITSRTPTNRVNALPPPRSTRRSSTQRQHRCAARVAPTC